LLQPIIMAAAATARTAGAALWNINNDGHPVPAPSSTSTSSTASSSSSTVQPVSSSESWSPSSSQRRRRMLLSRRQKALADAVAGVAAALVAQLVTYPLDVHKTRRQASSSHHHSSEDCDDDGDAEEEQSAGSRQDAADDDDGEGEEGKRRYRAASSTPTVASSSSSPSKGVVHNFAGWKVKVLHTAAATFCYFYLYSFLLSLHRARSRRRKGQPVGPGKVSNAARLLLSAAAAVLNTLLTLPLDGISSRQQVLPQSCCDDGKVAAAALSPDRQQPRSRILVSELWRGLVPSLMLCANPAINYTVYDALKDRVLRHRPKSQQSPRGKPQLSALQAFVLGVIAKFVATLVTYPLIRAKVLLMVGTNDEDAGNVPPSSSSSSSAVATLLQCLADDYRHHGIRGGWYRGCSLQLVHTLLKSALLMAIKEKITGSVREAVAMMMMTTTFVDAAGADGSSRNRQVVPN
jgi:Mitochondrial carrier protein